MNSQIIVFNVAQGLCLGLIAGGVWALAGPAWAAVASGAVIGILTHASARIGSD